MLFIDQLISRDGDRAKATAKVPTEGICLAQKPGLLPEFFIEVMAQAMAAANGYDAIQRDQKAGKGFLVGVNEFNFLANPRPDIDLRIEIEKTFDFGPVKIIKGEIFQDNLLLVKGEMKVWEEEPDDKSP